MSTSFHYLKFIPFLLLLGSNLNAQTVTYDNTNNSRDRNSFEACIGDQVTFTYTGFTNPFVQNDPDTLLLTNGSGPDLFIPLSTSNMATNNVTTNNGPNNNTTTYNGVITITVPPNATTGDVQLIENGHYIYVFNNNLIIHNPPVNFYLPQAPFCAMDTIPLIGIPAAGTFSTSPSSLISNSSLIGINAGWSSTANQNTEDVDITYAYTPKYISGSSCPNSIGITKTVQIRDNRLDTLDFQYIVTSDTPTINDRIVLDISSPIVEKISPNFSNFTHPVNFVGNYVNQINGSDIFFIEDAGYGNHPITMQYNNGGCIGALTANLDVLQPLQLSGLADTLCRHASPITITRDSRPEYAYTDTSITLAPTTIRKESNIILSVSTKDPAYQAAISQQSSTTNQEEYILHPALLPPNLDSIVIIMHYLAYITTTTDNTSIPTVSIDSSPIATIEYLITLVDLF